MPKNKKWSSRTTLGDSVYSFSVLDSAWPIWKYSPIFIQEQNEKSKFVFPWYWYWNFMIMTWHFQITSIDMWNSVSILWTFRLKVAIITDFQRSSGELVSHNAASGKSTACFSGFSLFVSFFVTRSLVTRQTAMQVTGCLKISIWNPETGYRGVYWPGGSLRKGGLNATENKLFGKLNRHVAVTWVGLCACGFNTGICIQTWIDKFWIY